MKIRVKFSKYGPLRFIGHLDVMRFFQKAIRRAGIDVVYTNGFSPHQVMSFAAPLGIGLCSLGEYMDVEIASHQGMEDLKNRLQKECPYGIDILNVCLLPEKAGNAMASVAAATYAVAFQDPEKSFSPYEAYVQKLLSQDEILVTKETKRSTAQVNIRPGIYECSIQDGALVFLVDASSAGNIRPEFVTDAFLALAGISVEKIGLQTVRMETWMNAGTETERRLVPLDAIGE